MGLVKRITCIAFICLLSPVFAKGPGQSAIDFLKKVKDGQLNLNPGGDTALRAHTSQDKIKVIRKRLENLAGELDAGQLELGEVREDGEFAAVIVRQLGDFDDSHLQVFPVAMVKAEKGWTAAPVLASFENSVAGYTVPLKKRLSSLENWMMRERVVDLQKLVQQSSERNRERIKNSIVGENLEGSDLVKITRAFLKACEERNQAAVLGFLGGLSVPLPEDWQERVIASRVAVSENAQMEIPWRLLVSPDVIRIPVHEEYTAERGMVSLACLDPRLADSRESIEKLVLFHFDFAKDPQGRWRIDLPGSLLRNDPDQLFLNEGLDADLLDRFVERLREKEPLHTSATAEEAVEAVIDSLKDGGLWNLMRWVDLSGNPKEARVSCAAAATKWWSLNEPESFYAPVRLGFHQEGNLAVASFQWFSMSQVDRFEMEELFFKKVEGGWVWVPEISSVREHVSQEILSNWLKEHGPEWRMTWKETLLGSSLRITSIPLERQVSEVQIRELIEGWYEALEKKDIRKALGFTAWLGEGIEIQLKALRNLSYELGAVSRISGIYRSGDWVAAGITSTKSNQTTHSFVPVLMTSEGPRIIPEIDLIAGETRTRDFLNGTSFDRLGAFVGKADLEELKGLFKKFQKEVRKD